MNQTPAKKFDCCCCCQNKDIGLQYHTRLVFVAILNKMLAVKDRSNNKRETEDNVDEEPLKRRRLDYGEDVQANDDSSATPRFIAFHFKILKSIYDESDKARSNKQTDDHTTTTAFEHHDDDLAVQVRTWATIDKFLHDRSDILKSKEEASRWSWIHEKALCVGKEDQQGEAVSPLKKHHSARQLLQQQQQHTSPPSHRPLYATTTQLSSTTPTKNYHPTNSNNIADDPFRIVARLLGNHSNDIRQDFEDQIASYKTLLESTNKRIAHLQKSLTNLQQTLQDEDQKCVSDLINRTIYAVHSNSKSMEAHPNNRNTSTPVRMEQAVSRVLELKTKIRLWSLLAADLKRVF